MPRTTRERLLRHCDRMKGNLDKALEHVVRMELEYSGWSRELHPDVKVIAYMLLAVQEKIDKFADANLRA